MAQAAATKVGDAAPGLELPDTEGRVHNRRWCARQGVGGAAGGGGAAGCPGGERDLRAQGRPELRAVRRAGPNLGA